MLAFKETLENPGKEELQEVVSKALDCANSFLFDGLGASERSIPSISCERILVEEEGQIVAYGGRPGSDNASMPINLKIPVVWIIWFTHAPDSPRSAKTVLVKSGVKPVGKTGKVPELGKNRRPWDVIFYDRSSQLSKLMLNIPWMRLTKKYGKLTRDAMCDIPIVRSATARHKKDIFTTFYRSAHSSDGTIIVDNNHTPRRSQVVFSCNGERYHIDIPCKMGNKKSKFFKSHSAEEMIAEAKLYALQVLVQRRAGVLPSPDHTIQIPDISKGNWTWRRLNKDSHSN